MSAPIRRLALSILLSAPVGLAALCAAAAPASAATPWWHVSTNVRPASIPPGGEGTLIVQAVNLGNAPTSGTVTLSDLVPAGLSIQHVSFFAFSKQVGKAELADTNCSVSGQEVSCATVPTASAYEAFIQKFLEEPPFNEPPFNEPPLKEIVKAALEEAHPKSEFEEQFTVAPLQPYEDLELRILVKEQGAGAAALNRAEVKGGSAAAQTLKRTIPISAQAPAFGPEEFAMVPEAEGGGVDTQAGSHPYQLTTTFDLNQTADPVRPPALARNLHFNLPPGLVGNATLLPQCSDLDFRHVVSGGYENLCPADTVVGVATVTIDEPLNVGLSTQAVPLFNLIPEKGEPARFGFEAASAPVTLDTSVRTGSDYGISVTVSNITELVNFISSTVTFWGVPGDQSHDSARGWSCLVSGHWTITGGRNLPCQGTNQTAPDPFLTMPSSCALPFTASVSGESWPTPAHPETFAARPYSLTDLFGRSLSVSGCNRLPFSPTIEVQPDVQAASTPTGLSVHVRVPQEVNHGAQGIASSSIKDTTVTLPAGVSTDPSGADGLAACGESEVGFQSVAPDGTDLFTANLPNPFCASASKIGTVEFKVPLIEHPLKGSIYLATQNQNPFGSLIALYIVAEDEQSGVLLKLAGEVKLNEETGQISTTFKNSPQAPLEEATFSFFGGDRAPLATPPRCGDYETQASFTPWSETQPVSASSTFQIKTGPNGGPCPNPLPFSPTLDAGSSNIQAGAFSPLSTTISRADGNQDIQTVQLHMPPGLSGILSGIPLCPEAEANAGSCSPASQIGKTTVSVGLGGDPFSVQGGQVFLTAGYKGAPFGLSIVNPAKAGPFDLGKVIVRAKIEVDLHSAALTVSTDPIPHILKGIPLQIKHVNVLIDRPGFTFNPTNCSPLSLTGAITSVQGASAAVQTPFQITNCAALKFAPKFAVTTKAKASKAEGASLNFKIAYPKGAMGSQSWFNEAKFVIPKQLPARLTTIQKACLAATFETNRAACPTASKIGTAIVHTPVLPVPLTGPVYFVSYGGAKFPDAVLVLDGYGVHIELHGETFIDGKTGVTSATFRNTPDVPFESIEVNVPTGPFSEFGANLPAKAKYSFCGQKLTMPTFFKAQNGLQIKQNTPVTVTGCAKKKALTRKQKLAKAMKACHRKHNKAKRASCEKQARKKYGPVKKKTKKKK
jgi:uncharacterized repeat protein (TIGR01451 family)